MRLAKLKQHIYTRQIKKGNCIALYQLLVGYKNIFDLLTCFVLKSESVAQVCFEISHA